MKFWKVILPDGAQENLLGTTAKAAAGTLRDASDVIHADPLAILSPSVITNAPGVIGFAVIRTNDFPILGKPGTGFLALRADGETRHFPQGSFWLALDHATKWAKRDLLALLPMASLPQPSKLSPPPFLVIGIMGAKPRRRPRRTPAKMPQDDLAAVSTLGNRETPLPQAAANGDGQNPGSSQPQIPAA